MDHSSPCFVKVKDESGRTIAILDRELVARLNDRFKALTSQFIAAPGKAEALRKARALQLRMKTGAQTRSDFTDEAALFGYAHYKFRLRGLTAYALLAAADAAHPSLRAAFRHGPRLARAPIIASIGGGPGNDAFGAMLWVRAHGGFPGGEHEYGSERDGARCLEEPPRLRVFDWAPGWSAVVARVAELDGLSIGFDTCDVCAPLDSPANAALLIMVDRTEEEAAIDATRPDCPAAAEVAERAAPDVFLFCYILNEVMNSAKPTDGGIPSWLSFVDELWRAAKPGTVFLFRDQHERAERAIVEHFVSSAEWTEGETFFWLVAAEEEDGLRLEVPPWKKQKGCATTTTTTAKKKKKKKRTPPPRSLAARKPEVYI